MIFAWIAAMLAPVIRIVTLIAVVLLALYLVPLVGPFVADSIPAFAGAVGQLLNALWDGLSILVNSF